MKKLVSLTLALLLALSALVVPAMAEEAPLTIRYGVLSMLNRTEEEMIGFYIAGWQAAAQGVADGAAKSNVSDAPMKPRTAMPKNECVYFDTLDAMVMALNSGHISTMIVNSTVADYLCANNDQLVNTFSKADSGEEQFFDTFVRDTFTTNDFAFMMLEGNDALRDAFNKAIAQIKADGTLDQLVADHIDTAIAGDAIAPVAMPKIDMGPTVRVAITGSLPPMDYIAPDGTPAGFNTALLAEISRRSGMNIELVQVDSMGRAAALASGTVDAVFWTRTNNASNALAGLSDEELAATIEEYKSQMTEAQAAVLDRMMERVDLTSIGKFDLPEGTIITDSYFADTFVPVITVSLVNAVNAR